MTSRAVFGSSLGRSFVVLGLISVAQACGGSKSERNDGSDGTGGAAWTLVGAGGCAPLPEPAGEVIEVTPAQAGELWEIVRDAPAHATIELVDGTYALSAPTDAAQGLRLSSEGLTLRSKSRVRENVILDGEYVVEDLVTISASNVTVADLTLRRARRHAVRVLGATSGAVNATVLHNLRITDGGAQFVKVDPGVAVPETYADHGVLQCSLLELTEAGRAEAGNTGACSAGGIDGQKARGWRVHKNVFRGIYCDGGMPAGHAVRFAASSRDSLIEDNLIIDCARGVAFGAGVGEGASPERAYDDEPYPDAGYVGHYDGLVRNNMVTMSAEFGSFVAGVELEQARGAQVLHNTIIHADVGPSIVHRFANTRVTIENNLVRSILAESSAEAVATSNLQNSPSDLFVSVPGHDLHLLPSAAAAIDRGIVLPDAGNDIDGDERDSAPDLGADELDE